MIRITLLLILKSILVILMLYARKGFNCKSSCILVFQDGVLIRGVTCLLEGGVVCPAQLRLLAKCLIV